MSASNRATLIGKLHSSLKKHYEMPPAQPPRPLLEHVLYASLLEDAPADLADEALAKCEQEFFDWNEVRVTTVTELSQVFSRLPEASKAAMRLKGNLQAIFEEFYTFDLDHLKKENLGKAVAKFENMPGMTPFVLSYTIQHGLGGHSIPIDYSAMVVMLTLGIASQSEAASGRVPGLERAIPKSKGIEFGSLLHQAAVALNLNPKDKTGRAMLDSVAKGSSKQLDEWLKSKAAAKKRVAQRRADEKAAREAEVAEEEVATETAKPAKPAKPTKKKAAGKKVAPEASPEKTAGDSKSSKKAAAGKKAPAKSKSKTSSAKAKAASKAAGSTKKSAPSAKSSKPKKTPTKKKSKKVEPAAAAGKSTGSRKKSSNRKLTKRKPR